MNCPRLKLVVEIDGDSHFEHRGKVYDKERTKTLERYGLKVIRFNNNDVMENLDGVVDKIEQALLNVEMGLCR